MLKCRSQIVSPFTKKLLFFRYDSVLRTPFGCSMNKKGVFLHLGNHKHLKKHIKCLKNDQHHNREQKQFFWTSIQFVRNDKNSKDPMTTSELIKNSAKNHDKDDKNDDAVKYTEDTSDHSSNENLSASPEKNNESAFSKAGIEKPDNFQKVPLYSKGKIKSAPDEKVPLKADPSSKVGMSGKKLVSEKILTHMPSDSDRVMHTFGLNQEKVNAENEATNLLESKPLTGHNRPIFEVNLGEISDKIILEPKQTYLYTEEKALNVIKPLKETPSSALLEKAKGILRKKAASKQEDDGRSIKTINLGPPKDTSLSMTSRRRQTVDLNRCSTERNFITPVRAMTDFLLKPSDLEGLRKTKRRSPYENDPPITVYWRKDVEAKALDVWGSKENLLKEILKRDIERRRYQQNLFTVKRRLRDYRREQGRETEIKNTEQNGLFGSSGKVVLTAIAINGTNFFFKMLACVYTGSHSMFSEAVHSLADTINQLILAYGIHKSVQRADSDHPYGYTNMRYVASLISGVGVFCAGSGLSFYHGFVGLTDPTDLPSLYWAYFILGGSLLSEGATLLVAFHSIRMGAKKSDMSFSEYVWRGQDPSVNVVLLEDAAAVIGVACAGCCMGLSSYYNSHIPDAIGSFLVGGLLAGVASFIIYTNVAALVGRSIPQERLDKINAELESDVMIRAIHDVKGIDIGNSLVRYKAEMDFDGGELTRSYLDKQDLNLMLEEVKKMNTIDDLEEFMLKHGENIVDMMGGEIDRIELKLRKKHPEIRHCDLEILCLTPISLECPNSIINVPDPSGDGGLTFTSGTGNQH